MATANIMPAEGKLIRTHLPIVNYVHAVVEPAECAKTYWVDGVLKFQWQGPMQGLPGEFTWLLDPFEAEKKGLCKITLL